MSSINISANEIQVGGEHYKSDYQHWDWAINTNLGPLEYAATKYVARWKKKYGNDKAKEDLQKAVHCVNKIKESFNQCRYPAAYTRLENPHNAKKEALRFCQINKFTVDQHLIFEILCSWYFTKDLNMAISLIEKMNSET